MVSTLINDGVDMNTVIYEVAMYICNAVCVSVMQVVSDSFCIGYSYYIVGLKQILIFVSTRSFR